MPRRVVDEARRQREVLKNWQDVQVKQPASAQPPQLQKFNLRSSTTAWYLAVIALLYALPAVHGAFVLSRPEASPGVQTAGSEMALVEIRDRDGGNGVHR